jgi:hypothetical protein
LGALLLIEMLPVSVPPVVGVNLAMKVAVPPAAMTWPTVNPLMLKPAPEALKAEIVSDSFPVFVSVMVCGLLLPTATLLKFSLLGLIDNWACVCVAVPLRMIVSGDAGALLEMVINPLGLPAAVGAN